MPKKAPPKSVKVNADNPESFEVIAASIIKIADSFNNLRNGPLNMRAIIILLSESSGVRRGEVEKIINAAQDLKRHYLK